MTTLAACAVAGCTGIVRGEVSLVSGVETGAPARRSATARHLRSEVRTEEAELSLVGAALDLVAASGRPRPSIDGHAHFRAPGTFFYRLDLVRSGAVGAETWRLDGAWAVRELPGGAALCWEGDLRLVVETLGVILPASPGATGGVALRRSR